MQATFHPHIQWMPLMNTNSRLIANIHRLQEDELREISSKFNIDYDNLPGSTKVEKVNELIHLLEDVNRFGRGDHFQNAEPYQPESFSHIGNNGSESSIEAESILVDIFEGQPIALINSLTTGLVWEYWVTRILYRLFPQRISNRVKKLSEQVDNIDFLRFHDEENCYKFYPVSDAAFPNSLALDTTDDNEVCISAPYINFHSVRCWYASLRNMIKWPLIALSPLLYFILFFTPLIFTWTVVSTFLEDEGVLYITQELMAGNEYYVRVVGSQTDVFHENDYALLVSKIDANSDFTGQSIFEINYGDHVQNEIMSLEQQIYHVGTVSSGIPFAIIDDNFVDAKLQFTMLDSQLNECAQLEIPSYEEWVLSCEQAGQDFYIKVEVVEDIFLGAGLPAKSAYGFRTFELTGEEENNNSTESSNLLNIGSGVRGNGRQGDIDWFAIVVDENQKVEFSSYFADSLTLFELRDNKLKPLAMGISSRLDEVGDQRLVKLITSKWGQALLLSAIFRLTGLNISPEEISQRIMFLPGLFIGALFFLYLILFYALSERRFDDSKLVENTLHLLEELGKPDILAYENQRAYIRRSIALVSEGISKLYSMSHFPYFFAAPKDTEIHYKQMASQVLQMGEKVSLPESSTVYYLREKFVDWLSVFLTERYGQFKFTDGFQYKPRPWYEQIEHGFQLHAFKILVFLLLAIIFAAITHPFWKNYTTEIISIVWLGLRYIILILSSYGIYLKWGKRDTGDETDNKWENAVRLILFFFIPFFAIDLLLNTGVFQTLIQLIDSLSIF